MTEESSRSTRADESFDQEVVNSIEILLRWSAALNLGLLTFILDGS